MTSAVLFNSASELATLTNTFSVAGTPTDPTTITLTVTSPSGVVSSPTPTHGGTGAYTADVTCDEDGTWQYLWIGTGTATDASPGTWVVQETDLGRLYCPIESLKSRLGISHTQADFELHAACFAASRWVEQYTERTFWRTISTARTFEPNTPYHLTLPPFCDLVSAASVKTDTAMDGTYGTTITAGSYQLLPHNPSAAPEQQPYTEIEALQGAYFPCTRYNIGVRRDSVQITGIWGWPKVPLAIRQATAIIAADTFKLKDAPLGVAGEGEFTVQVGENRRALKFLDPYRRSPVLVA